MSVKYIVPESIEKRGDSWFIVDNESSFTLSELFDSPTEFQSLSNAPEINYYIMYSGDKGRFFTITKGNKAISCRSFMYSQTCYVFKEMLIEVFDFQSTHKDVKECLRNIFSQGVAHAALIQGQDNSIIVTPDDDLLELPKFDVELTLTPLLAFETSFFSEDNLSEDKSLVIVNIDINNKMICTERLTNLSENVKSETNSQDVEIKECLTGFERYVSESGSAFE